MGQVWCGEHTVTKRNVALKFVKDGLLSADAKRRLLKEARSACAVEHPAIVPVHDIIESASGEPALVMDLLEGESLAARLTRERVISWNESARIMLPVAEALVAAHAAGIIHRDLKPDNVFLTTGGGVKVLDFGIAKQIYVDAEAAKSAGTQEGAVLGTPMYMSPEQAFAEQDVDHRTDIWSLGLILFECLTGVLPTRADNLGQVLKIILTQDLPGVRELATDVPGELASLVDQMLRRRREERTQRMGDVVAVLASMVSVDKGTGTTPTSQPRSNGVVVRVSDSDSNDAWDKTQAPSKGGSVVSGDADDSFLQQIAALPFAAPPQAEPDRTGQRVSHYQVVKKVGQGGMGIVYAAEDVRLKRRVALKVLPAGLVTNDERRRRFLREARSASAVQHPNVATIFDVGEMDGTVYLAMEFVEGRTLRELIEADGGRLQPRKAVHVALQMARGLARAHGAGVIHRDVKPENVMIATDDTVKLLDFGLAKLAGTVERSGDGAHDDSVDDLTSRVGRVLGTPAYMSPEQAAGSTVDARTDVYAMGVVMHEMLVGGRPSRDDRRISRDSGARLALPLMRVIDRCLCPQPEDRYADGRELAEELARLDARLAERARPAPRLGIAMALGGAAIVGGLAWWGAGSRAGDDAAARAEPVQPGGDPVLATGTAELAATAATTATEAPPTALESASAAVSGAPSASASAPASASAKHTVRRAPVGPDPLEHQK